MESEWLDPSGTFAVGRRGRMAMKFFGRRSEYIDEVTAYEPGGQVAHRTVEGPYQLETACLCEPAESGCRTTVLAETERFVGKLVDPLVSRLLRRGFRADLMRLKEILEVDSPTTLRQASLQQR